jgi:hypothetical protein
MIETQDTLLSTPNAWPGTAAEAARYALLRRLAPSIRHHLVVNLQPIGMIYEVLDRRLRAPEPNLESVHDSARKIHGFARAALDSCVDIVSWLAPDDATPSSLHDGARECAGLVASSLSFRGYALRNEVEAVEGEVRRSSLRFLLSAALLHATDELAPPAELVLRGSAEDEGARLVLAVRASNGDKGFANEPAYRHMTWGDLLALAEAEHASVSHGAAGEIVVLLPWLR